MILPYQQRVIDEKTELDELRERIAAFLGSHVFLALPAGERERLRRQLSIMDLYSDVLGERIESFPRS